MNDWKLNDRTFGNISDSNHTKVNSIQIRNYGLNRHWTFPSYRCIIAGRADRHTSTSSRKK